MSLIIRSNLGPVLNMLENIFGFKYKSNQTRSEHLSRYYDDMCMFALMMMCRIRSKKSFVDWSLISSMASYGTTVKGPMFTVTSFFGLTCSYTTLTNRLKEYCNPKSFYAKMDRDVEHYGWIDYEEKGEKRTTDESSAQVQPCRLHVSISMFDNSQRGVKHKHQTSGSSSSMVRLTSRAYMKPWFGPWKLGSIPSIVQQPITFIKQKVPSPMGMPPFELLIGEDGTLDKSGVSKMF